MTDQDLFADLGGLRICYRQDGPAGAPALILIAGLGMQLIEWPEALVDTLARAFRVIRIDNRDSGLSGRCGGPFTAVPSGFSWTGSAPGLAGYDLRDMAGDVLALADHLGLARFGCIGFSMGGMIAQLVACRAPDRVTRMVSLSSSGGEGVVTSTPEAVTLMELFFLPFATRDAAIDAILDSNAYFSLGLLPRDSAENREVAETLLNRAEDDGGYLRQALAITSTPPWRADLVSRDVPSLFLHGSADPCIPPAPAQAAARTMPNGTFTLHPGLGHWIDAAICDEVAVWLAGPCGEAQS